MKPITEFQKDYRWLSNFAPATVKLDGVMYPSVENAYQAAKTVLPEERHPFIICNANEAKKLGRSVTMRNGWDSMKEEIMLDLLIQKYTIPEYQQRLMATGEVLLSEGNYWNDRYWGVDLRTGKGENRLGQLIMKVREMMREKPALEIIDMNAIRHFGTPKFLQDIPPWKEIIPALGELICVAPELRTGGIGRFTEGVMYVTSEQYIFTGDKTMTREEYREKLRENWQRESFMMLQMKEYVKMMMDGRCHKIIVTSRTSVKENYHAWEIRRALIGMLYKEVKPYVL